MPLLRQTTIESERHHSFYIFFRRINFVEIFYHFVTGNMDKKPSIKLVQRAYRMRATIGLNCGKNGCRHPQTNSIRHDDLMKRFTLQLRKYGFSFCQKAQTWVKTVYCILKSLKTSRKPRSVEAMKLNRLAFCQKHHHLTVQCWSIVLQLVFNYHWFKVIYMCLNESIIMHVSECCVWYTRV